MALGLDIRLLAVRVLSCVACPVVQQWAVHRLLYQVQIKFVHDRSV